MIGRSRRTASRLRARRVIAAIDGIVAANALGGMVYALGGAGGVPSQWLEGSPFSDYRIPGVYLGVIVGGSCLTAAWAAGRDDPRARAAALTSSATMLSWISAQIAVIGYRSPLQPAIAVIGATVGLVALKEL